MAEKAYAKMKDYQYILDALPFSKPFLFVSELDTISEEGAEGRYTFPPDASFYEGHFKGKPVTPGVLLTECMAQIGLACLGIYLLLEEPASKEQPLQSNTIALSSTQVDFYLPVYPGETVRVISKKEYFRFQKLKCSVRMLNANNELICKGILSGMIIPASK